ncbi:MAG: hypothetical protein RLN70_01545 [Rhodospirillaceae bacterium]
MIRFASLGTFVLLIMAVLTASEPARADCMRDLFGEVVCDRGKCARDFFGTVFCSAFEDGEALLDGYGVVVCAKGQCVRTLEGEIICSARPGGAALENLFGEVTCDGACEPASAAMCGQNSAPADRPASPPANRR